ncbi:MAG: TssN family type VI secretion system protein [Dysgonamonadaceae bacterium]|jgi:hypothetical protein|nr:TssN family type VI secretion system protein [Dysgonamonadaceae bacterium]
MEIFLGKFVLMYLLMPLIGILLGVVMFFIAKKNKLLSNKKAVAYILSACLLLAVPALLGFIDYAFMPLGYLVLTSVYLLLGYLNVYLTGCFFDEIRKKPYVVEFFCQFTLMFIGAALFSLVFNLCNELQYGLWASTCLLPFIFPSLFLKTYNTYIAIPLEIYNVWLYENENDEMETKDFDSSRIIVVELEIFKQVEDFNPLNIKAKAAENAPFGVWFKMFLRHYNTKSPNCPIAAGDTESSYGWIFYVNTFLVWKRSIDPALSFAENKIKDKKMIIAKRVQRTENQ